MNIYDVLVHGYNQVLGIFPAPLQWIVTLALTIGLVMAVIGLVKQNALFLIVIVLFLPVIVPVIGTFFANLYAFFLFLLAQLGIHAAGS